MRWALFGMNDLDNSTCPAVPAKESRKAVSIWRGKVGARVVTADHFQLRHMVLIGVLEKFVKSYSVWQNVVVCHFV